MIIRAFARGDRQPLIALWRSCELVVPWNDPDADLDAYLGSGQQLLLVAEDAGTLVGSVMAGFDGHRAWLYYLAVAPAHRRRGYARALVRRAEHELAGRGAPKMNLMVRSGNESVLAFYAALGYEPSPVMTLGRRLD